MSISAMLQVKQAIFPDPRELSKLFSPGGPFAPHRCSICYGLFEVGQHFYNFGQGEVVHVACRFPEAKNK